MNSDYTHEILTEDKIIVIVDQDLGGLSVTNNIETVVEDIAKKHGLDLNEHRIIYADSLGLWDGWDHKNKRFISLATDNRKTALERIKNKVG